jgi:hypothetical protein
MSRISLDVTEEEHKRLKALAALQGVSLKEYLLRNSLPDKDDEQALAELERFLDERTSRAAVGKISKQTVGGIFKQAYRETDGRKSIW